MTALERKLLLTIGHLVLQLCQKLTYNIWTSKGPDMQPILANMEEVRLLGKELHDAHK